MSNSIEERAALNLRYERDFLGNDLSENMVRRAYIRGATEQKVIETKETDGWLLVNNISTDANFEDFREVMK